MASLCGQISQVEQRVPKFDLDGHGPSAPRVTTKPFVDPFTGSRLFEFAAVVAIPLVSSSLTDDFLVCR